VDELLSAPVCRCGAFLTLGISGWLRSPTHGGRKVGPPVVASPRIEAASAGTRGSQTDESATVASEQRPDGTPPSAAQLDACRRDGGHGDPHAHRPRTPSLDRERGSHNQGPAGRSPATGHGSPRSPGVGIGASPERTRQLS
jgi:hypothetical protein